jgi:N-acyl-L-homoserine lactone synthetase
VTEHGWAALPGALERDVHDARAVHVGAWAGGTLAGAMRLVLPAPGRLLPVEEDFGVTVEPRGAVAEAGRLVVAPERRGDPDHRLWGALFACTWTELRARGLTVLAGAASPRMVERLRALGLPFEVLGPAREHWGELRHPVRLDPAQGRPHWRWT